MVKYVFSISNGLVLKKLAKYLDLTTHQVRFLVNLPQTFIIYNICSLVQLHVVSLSGAPLLCAWEKLITAFVLKMIVNCFAYPYYRRHPRFLDNIG